MITRTDAIKKAVAALLEKQREFIDTNEIGTLRIDLKMRRGVVDETQFMPLVVDKHDRINGYNFST